MATLRSQVVESRPAPSGSHEKVEPNGLEQCRQLADTDFIATAALERRQCRPTHAELPRQVGLRTAMLATGGPED